MKPYLIFLIGILLVSLGIGGYFLVKKNKKNNPSTASTNNLEQLSNTATTDNSTNNNDLSKEFKNDDHKLSFNYPEGWKTQEVKGKKNVTEPLVREDVAYIYDPVDATSDKAKATLKLLRFVIEPDKKIKSQDDWYKYVKDKVDRFLAQKDLVNEIGYNLISLEKVDDIDGHYTVREDYNLKDNVRGRDFYIFSKDIYQFVFESFQNDFDKYSSVLNKIVNSFKINN